MTIEALEAREALEDKVYDLYPELDMTDIQRMTDNQLMELVNLNRSSDRSLPDQPKPLKPVKPIAAKWIKVYSDFEIRNDQLVLVETWRKNGIDHEKIEPCKNRVTYKGKQVSASILKHYLLTGEWIKRIPKPMKPFKAVVYSNGKALHLGYFATLEQKDAAIFAFKLGIVPQV